MPKEYDFSRTLNLLVGSRVRIIETYSFVKGRLTGQYYMSEEGIVRKESMLGVRDLNPI